MRRLIATAAASLCLALLAGALAAALVLQAGWYDASAIRPHFQFVHTLIERGMQQSVRFHARDIVAPPAAAGAVARGGAVFRQHCEQCHGGPGMPMGVIGLSMQPVPGPLADAARRWKAREMYWITSNGIKMSGMPAWRFHLGEQEVWDVVAFLGALPAITPAEYAAIAKPAPLPRPGTLQAPAGAPDRERGRLALTQFACQSCHHIPGVTGPLTYVGPDLGGLAHRSFIAGKLPATQENLVQWIRTPQEVKPGTAMPQLGVPERDARDMAAYLLQPAR
ncbi:MULTISPECIES: c-type cytochrome [unclassified Duganella]|uniref:c-type cytochrome n=1 Tax=unclassified Duganella TaxID=2636909 RepID=UPI001E5A7AFF|nr:MULTISPECIES: c-type cytochrome [unclassified Duganella]